MNKIRKNPAKRVFPYYYKNGELHAFKLGSFGENREALYKQMDEEIKFLKNSRRKINTWIDLYKTDLSLPVMERLVDVTASVADQIALLALVGKINLYKRNRLRRMASDKQEYKNTIIRFFSDPEDAKTWLVKGEGWLK